MLIDNAAIVMEQNPPGDPGRYGDSCAESSRYQHLKFLLGDYKLYINFNQFITPLGVIRSPNVPEEWKEKDTSEDQVKPLLLALRKGTLPEALIVEKQIKNAGYRTGNGDLITPGFYGIIKEWSWLNNISVCVQSIIFKIPLRWSDSKKWFERSEASSADYLNHIHVAVYSPKWIRKMVSKETLKQKVRDYYKVEPNSEWVIQTYDQVIERYW